MASTKNYIYDNATFIQGTGVSQLPPKAGGALTYNSATGLYEAPVAAPALARQSNIPLGSVALGSLGTDTTIEADVIFASEWVFPVGMSVTKVAILNGTVGGTDKARLGIMTADGQTLVCQTATAGTTLSGSNDTFQEIALTAVTFIPTGRYWFVALFNGTTTKIRTIAASTYLNYAKDYDSTSTFTAGFVAITPPTSTEANVGPIVYAV